MITLNPGTVVAIKFGMWEHWGIVAFDLYGRLTLISNRGVKNGVTEELWQYVVGNAKWRIVKDLVGDVRKPQKWLHDHGAALHRYAMKG